MSVLAIYFRTDLNKIATLYYQLTPFISGGFGYCYRHNVTIKISQSSIAFIRILVLLLDELSSHSEMSLRASTM